MSDKPFDHGKIALIGVPSSAGARQTGQEQAPNCLRAAGLVERLVSLGLDVADLGDVTEARFEPDPEHPNGQNLASVVDVLGEVAESVEMAVSQRAWPLVIGGDCSITIGVAAALTRHFPELGLAYIDGDVDLNTPETTLTGIFDGMVMAHLLGRGADELTSFADRYPLLDEHRVILFGYSVRAGGVDAAEIEALNESRMIRVPFEEIGSDASEAGHRALRELQKSAEQMLVHFDVDVIDHDEFPAVDVPHSPGLRFDQARDVLGFFAGSRNAVGLVVTEFNAAEDADGSLARKLIGAVESALAPRA